MTQDQEKKARLALAEQRVKLQAKTLADSISSKQKQAQDQQSILDQKDPNFMGNLKCSDSASSDQERYINHAKNENDKKIRLGQDTLKEHESNGLGSAKQYAQEGVSALVKQQMNKFKPMNKPYTQLIKLAHGQKAPIEDVVEAMKIKAAIQNKVASMHNDNEKVAFVKQAEAAVEEQAAEEDGADVDSPVGDEADVIFAEAVNEAVENGELDGEVAEQLLSDPESQEQWKTVFVAALEDPEIRDEVIGAAEEQAAEDGQAAEEQAAEEEQAAQGVSPEALKTANYCIHAILDDVPGVDIAESQQVKVANVLGEDLLDGVNIIKNCNSPIIATKAFDYLRNNLQVAIDQGY